MPWEQLSNRLRLSVSGFNVGLEQRKWAIADGLGFIPKDHPETCHRNFDPTRRRWLPRFDTPRDIIWMGTWRTLHPRRILHAPGAISVHGSFRQAILEPGQSGQELRTLPTGHLLPPSRLVWKRLKVYQCEVLVNLCYRQVLDFLIKSSWGDISSILNQNCDALSLDHF